MSNKSLLTIFIFLGVFSDNFAQAFYAVRHDHDLIVSVGTGTSTYFGEIHNPGDNFDFQPNFNIGAQVLPFPNFLGNRLNLRAELNYFRLNATDADANDDREERNLSFFSNNWELNAVGMLHLFQQDRKFYLRSTFNIYGLFGVGLLYTNPKTEYQGDKVALQPLQTEATKYSRFQFVIPYGMGIKFKSGPLYNIAIEGAWRKTFTDYLDDVSVKRYPDPAILQSDLSRALSDRRRERDPDYPIKPGLGVRGNPETKDGYFLLNVKVEYYLPVDMKMNDKRLMTVKRKRYR